MATKLLVNKATTPVASNLISPKPLKSQLEHPGMHTEKFDSCFRVVTNLQKVL